MSETLFLQQSGYPAGFGAATNEVEGAILQSINSSGKNRNVENVRYVDLKSCFKHFDSVNSKFVGVICSSEVIESGNCIAPTEYCWIEEIGDKRKLYRIQTFVIMTPNEIKSRNAYISQSVFPFLFTHLPKTLKSPCKILSLFPIYLLVMTPKDVTIPPSVAVNLNFLSAAGVRVLAPFSDTYIISESPLTIEEMMVAQGKHPIFSIDPVARVFQVNRDGLDALIDENGNIKGSSEKFGMIILLPAALVARRSGYSLDAHSLLTWLDQLNGRWDRHSKIANLSNVYQFLMKISI